MRKIMIEVKNLKKRFADLEVLKGVSFTLNKGEVLVVIGPSGSGKSTLLRCMNFLERAEEGTIKIGDVLVDSSIASNRDIQYIRGLSSMIFQNYCLFSNKTALENIMEPMVAVQKIKVETAREKAMEILRAIGLPDKKDVYPAHLSGGQQQRIGIGRAMAVNSQVMLIDEPTSSLDPELIGEVLKLLYQLAKKDTTMIIATHEMEFAENIADKVIFMDKGEIIEEGKPKDIFKNPQSERLKQFLNKFTKTKENAG